MQDGWRCHRSAANIILQRVYYLPAHLAVISHGSPTASRRASSGSQQEANNNNNANDNDPAAATGGVGALKR